MSPRFPNQSTLPISFFFSRSRMYGKGRRCVSGQFSSQVICPQASVPPVLGMLSVQPYAIAVGCSSGPCLGVRSYDAAAVRQGVIFNERVTSDQGYTAPWMNRALIEWLVMKSVRAHATNASLPMHHPCMSYSEACAIVSMIIVLGADLTPRAF